MRARPCSSWRASARPLFNAPVPEPSTSQYTQPPKPFEPSRLGHVEPASSATRCTGPPKRSKSHGDSVRYGSTAVIARRLYSSILLSSGREGRLEVQIQPIVVGTAGHIDHGKSSLVKAITGIDPDRLKEEQERGMTIDLGFARFALPDGRKVGIVDVPGHERFIKNMVAGASGIDLVILVVAADDGVMPQTREHLAIMTLLGIQRGLVAITKIDAVDEDTQALAIDDVRTTVRGTFLEGAPILPLSSVTREGLPEFF